MINEGTVDRALIACVRQGWVPENCSLDGELVFALKMSGEDPCAGCNENRRVCKGRPKQSTTPQLYSQFQPVKLE